MGDVAMTVPVISALIQQYPEIKITVLTRAFFSPFFNHLKNVATFCIDEKGKHKGLIGLYKLSRELKQLEIDAVADLHNVLRSNILKLFFRVPFFQINKGRKEKKALTSNKQFRQLKTTHQRYVDVFKKLGFSIDLSHPVFPEKRNLSINTRAELNEKSTNKWLGIAPFAQYESKMYPLDLMEIVITELSEKFKIILLGGGIKEVDYLNKLAKKIPQVTNIAGKLSFIEELDVISNLDGMLSMDSGNAHIAAMFGIPTITIWGVTHPYAGFYPFHQNIENALLADKAKYPKIPTSIYGNKYPVGYKDASRTILPKTIIDKVNTII